MNYYKKYIKYKTKYNFLKFNKNIQFGGNNGKLIIDNVDVSNKLTILSYDVINNLIVANRRKPDTDTILTMNDNILEFLIEKIKYKLINISESFMNQIFAINGDEYLLKIEYEYNGVKNFVELSKTLKLFNINFIYENNTYSLYILSNINDFETPDLQQVNYFIQGIKTSSDFILKIKNNDSLMYELKGICQITKSKIRLPNNKYKNEIIFDINKINNFNCNIYNLIDIQHFFIKKFDFQNSYDKLKTEFNYCPESTILFKHIYNTYYNFYVIEENNFFSLYHNIFGGLIEHIITQKINKNKDIIRNLCLDKQNRQNLLSNIMKRIETTMNKGVIIKKNDGSFIDLFTLNPLFNLIFDTGNSSHTIITIDIVKALGLIMHDTFPIIVSGVSGTSTKLNKYVNIELYFDPNITNIDINKHFKFRAYVQDFGLTNTILLGQSAYALKQFFDNSYCIGYNTTRLDYEKLKFNAINKYSHYYDIMNDINIFLENLEKFNIELFNKLYEEIKLMDIQHILSYIESYQVDEIYQLYNKIKQQIKKKYNIIEKITKVSLEFTDFINRLNKL